MNRQGIFSFLSFGYEGTLVKVEVDIKSGLPMTEIVGLPGGAVKESRERVRAAIKNSGVEFPNKRILINLSPASEKKDGSGFDLAIALALLHKMRECELKEPLLVLGELELSGRVLPVAGVLAGIFCGLQAGIKTFIVPAETKCDSCIPPVCKVYGIKDLTEALSYLETITNEGAELRVSTETAATGKQASLQNDSGHFSDEAAQLQNPKNPKAPIRYGFPAQEYLAPITWPKLNPESDFSEVRGQETLISALEIAAVGGHNLMAYGPPGCGKSLALSRFQELLPELDLETSREVSRIYSIAGLNTAELQQGKLIRVPPFRIPHQSASLEGIIGGAGRCLPGEISLAHGGALFLDEANQFKASVLQSLRAPLETGFVTLSRAEKRTTFPARFQLLVALNPCPCGNAGSPDRFCTCSPQVLDRFWKRLTSPLLDRIDLRLFVLPPSRESLLEPSKTSTKDLRKRIENALLIQYQRNFFFQTEPKTTSHALKNAFLPPEKITQICTLTPEAKRAFYAYADEKLTSGRGSHAILKLARTISDIEEMEKINSSALEKAIALRTFEEFLPDM